MSLQKDITLFLHAATVDGGENIYRQYNNVSTETKTINYVTYDQYFILLVANRFPGFSTPKLKLKLGEF